MKSFYKLLSFLNLDVVAGAVLSSAAVAQYLELSAPPVLYWLLGSSTWMIYTLDRLLDIRRMKQEQMSGRHFFHWKYRIPLGFSVLLLLLWNSYLAFAKVPLLIFYFGLLVLLCVGIYLFILQLSRPTYFPKELLIALVYTAAIWGPALLMAGRCSSQSICLYLLHSLLAFQNLLLFACLEVEEDLRSGQSSIAILIRPERSQYWMRLIGVLYPGLLLLTYWTFPGSFSWTLLFLLMHVSLQAIFFARKDFRHEQLYRYLGDAVFCFPALLLF